MSGIPCYIFDIDGTLADCSHRLHYIQSAPKNWAGFFAAVGDDAPIDHVIDLCMRLAETAPIMFVSGRSDECRGGTMSWLYVHFGRLQSDQGLYMRKAGDHRDDAIVKIELLAQIRADGYEPMMAFEDRDRVVAAWRAAGIPCAQVAAGDF